MKKRTRRHPLGALLRQMHAGKPDRAGLDRGQATLAAGLSLLMLALLAGGVVDLARLWETRLWAYRAAEAAALAGASAGRDYTHYVASGFVRLDVSSAQDAAQHALLTVLSTRGLDSAGGYDIRVHPDASAGSYPGFPPVAHAAMGVATWNPNTPAVAVYLVVPLRPILYGWINGNRDIDIRVFASAGVVL